MPTLLASDTLTTMYGVHPSILGRVTHLFTQDELTPTREDVAQVLALHSKQGLGLELTRAYQVFLLIRAVHTLGIHPYSLNTPPLLTTITRMGKEIIAKNLTADPPDLSTTIQSVLALVPNLDLAELDDSTSDGTAPDLAPSSTPTPAAVIAPQPAPVTVTTSGPPTTLHADASAVPDQTATPYTWTEIDTTPDDAPPAHPVMDTTPAPAHTQTEIDPTPEQPSVAFTATTPAPASQPATPAHAWTEVDTTPDTPSSNPAPEVMATPNAAPTPATAPTVHLSNPIGRHAAPQFTPVHGNTEDQTAADMTEPVTGDSVTATTTLTFTAFPAAPAPSVDAEDTATPEPHATPAAAHPTFHKNAVTAPAASGSVAASDAPLMPDAEPHAVTYDTAPYAVTSPVVTQVIDAPAGEPILDGPAGPLPWVAANRDATPEEVMAYLTDHQDVDGVLVSLEALQPFRLYMVDLEAFYRDNPHQKAGADFTEIREIARVAQEILLTLTTLTDEDFALLAPEARIIIESASRLLA